MKKAIILAILLIGCNTSKVKEKKDKYYAVSGIRMGTFERLDSSNWMSDGVHKWYDADVKVGQVYYIDVKADTIKDVIKEFCVLLDSATPEKVCALKQKAREYINNLNYLDSCK